MNFLLKRLNKVVGFFTEAAIKTYASVKKHKLVSTVVSLVLILSVVLVSITMSSAFTRNAETADTSQAASPDTPISISSQTQTSSSVSSSAQSENVSSKPSVSKVTSSKQSSHIVSKTPTSSAPAVSVPFASGNSGYKYNSNLDIEDNVFMDALVYTGYNLAKHRADGMMWHYLLASQKRARGWLSKITYAGGSTGYETTANGLPDIGAFEKNGLVCASFVTYVYFNYLPNIAGIDTSSLPKPADPKLAHDWYITAKQWISNGYSRSIPFTATKIPAGNAGYVKFNPSENIPIGSIVIFRDARYESDRGSHAAIYAGYANGYNWIYHVGNENGPEFCAIERVLFGPDPQWPIMVITPPSSIRLSAFASVSVKDESGAPVSGVDVDITNTKNGAITSLGVTNDAGITQKEGLHYGEHKLTYTIPNGYVSDATSITVNLTAANNSQNTINIVLKKKEAPVSAETTEHSATENITTSVTTPVTEAP